MTFKSLLFIWRDKNSSLYFHIGTLTYDGEMYSFEYTYHSKENRKLFDAMKHGFTYHPAFKDIKKKYTSTALFPAFDRRAPSPERIDYFDILSDLNLSFDADRMDMLKKTRGIISNDPYFLESPLRLKNNNKLVTDFYISGMRHRELSSEWENSVEIGDTLTPVLEEDNTVDPYAIKLMTNNDLWLGYVPGVYAQAVHALIKRKENIEIVVEAMRTNYAPQWWVKVSFESSLSAGKNKMSELSELVVA